jgi:hypothetical protein
MPSGLKIYDTTTSGQSLIASLTGKEFGQLEYKSAINTASVPAPITGVIGNIPYNVFLQNLIEPVPVNKAIDGQATVFISSADSAVIANNFFEFYNLSSSNQMRTTQYLLTNSAEFPINLGVLNGSNNYIAIANIYGSENATQVLFSSASLPGQRVFVFVTRPTETKVLFTIAPTI